MENSIRVALLKENAANCHLPSKGNNERTAGWWCARNCDGEEGRHPAGAAGEEVLAGFATCRRSAGLLVAQGPPRADSSQQSVLCSVQDRQSVARSVQSFCKPRPGGGASAMDADERVNVAECTLCCCAPATEYELCDRVQ